MIDDIDVNDPPHSIGIIPPTVDPIASVIQIIVFRDMYISLAR